MKLVALGQKTYMLFKAAGFDKSRKPPACPVRPTYSDSL